LDGAGLLWGLALLPWFLYEVQLFLTAKPLRRGQYRNLITDLMHPRSREEAIAEQVLAPDGWGRWDFKGKELTGRTLGIIGLGNVGRRVSALAGGAFNMKVLAYDPYITPEDFRERGAEPVGFDDIFSASDFVSVNCPLTEETTNMIGAGEYRMMKRSAYFITTARGGIHDEAALADVLSEGLIAGAGLDVFDPEPPPADHPLMAFDNVIISPHVAGITDDCTHNMASWAARQWLTIFRGRRPPRLINPEAWPAYRERYRRVTGEDAED